jgi:HD superfamily phosphohydrolase
MMYRTVYWHRQVRSATAVIKKALINSLESGKISDTELYDLDDTGLFTLLGEKTGDPLVESVHEGRFFITAADIPHEQVKLEVVRDIKCRPRLEEQLACELGLDTGSIIIDVPEPVSFETFLYVFDEGCNFSESSSAFKTETVNAFRQTLYTIRIFTDQKYKDNLKTFQEICSILNKVIDRED